MSRAAQLPSGCDLVRDLICPQLLRKKEYDRNPEPLDVAIANVKHAFLNEFRHCLIIALEEHPEARRILNPDEFPDTAFHEFWTIETFDDCEEVD
jgi:hypothetical protein